MDYLERARKFRTKKRLGQNFLIDECTIEEITKNIKPDDCVLEIGPGVGFVTEQIVRSAKYLRAVELDEEAIKVLSLNLKMASVGSGEKCDFEIIHNDILKTNLPDLQNENKEKFKIVANIPYYITSPILAHLLGEIDEETNKNRGAIDEIILMVQYEVAKRLVADKNSPNKEYGMLSILAQMWADVEITKFVSSKCFWPRPKVDSAIVRLKIRKIPKAPLNPYFKRVVKAAFSQRRKTLKNCLQMAGFKNIETVLARLEIPPSIRGEKLSIADFAKLSKELYENKD